MGDFTKLYQKLQVRQKDPHKIKYLQADVVFLSPPWGGPSYIDQESYDLRKMSPDGYTLYELAKVISKNICFLLPRNSDPQQLWDIFCSSPQSVVLSPFVPGVELEGNFINQKMKTLTVYFGNLITEELEPTEHQTEEFMGSGVKLK